MNTKHTPGPWRVSLNKHDECEVHSDSGEWIAVVPHQCVTALVPIQEANARLIAAAPTMYQRLVLEIGKEAADAIVGW